MKVNLRSNFALVVIYVVIAILFSLLYAFNFSDFTGTLGSSTTYIEKALNSLYLSFVTVTTLGYGDIYPKTALMKLAVVSQAVLGIFLFGYILNEIGRRRSEKAERDYQRIIEANHQKEANSKILSVLPLVNLQLKNCRVRAELLSVGASKYIQNKGKVIYDPKFPFTNLHEMYHPYPTAEVSISETCASEYYSSVHRLRQELRDFIATLDRTENQEIHDLVVNLIFAIDCNSGEKKILGSQKIMTGNVQDSVIISRELQSQIGKNIDLKNIPLMSIAPFTLHMHIKGIMFYIPKLETSLTEFRKSHQ